MSAANEHIQLPVAGGITSSVYSVGVHNGKVTYVSSMWSPSRCC